MKISAQIVCSALLLTYHASVQAIVSERSITLNIASSAINTPSANVLNEGALAFSPRFDYYQYKPFSNEQLLNLSLQVNRPIESSDHFKLTSLSFAFGVTDKLTIGSTWFYSRLTSIRSGEVALPTEEDEEAEISLLNLGSSEGIADAILYGQWLMLNNKKQGLAAMLIFGSILPTGRKNVIAHDGNLFSSSDQPGRGSLAPFLGLSITKVLEKKSLSANFQYTQGLVGAQKANLGNIYNYNFAYVHQFSPLNSKIGLDGIVELNGELFTHTHIKGKIDYDTGGHIIYITSGLRVENDKISPFIASSIPLYQRPNGIQSKIRYLFTCGIDFTFE